MPAGVTIRSKRKAGAFAGGDLVAGELGVDTTNGELYFSSNGITVFRLSAIKAGSVLNAIVLPYEPTAAQLLTTTHADVAGSSYSYSPVSASSKILYHYSFHQASGDVVGVIHVKLLNNGVLAAKSETSSQNGESVLSGIQDTIVPYEYVVSSWGLSAQTLKLQAREHGGALEAKLHETYTFDGAVSSKLRQAVLTIIEFV